MIKDVMVYLDGSAADEVRLAAAADIAEYYDSHVVGLFLNVLHLIVPSEMDGISVLHVQEFHEQARKRGDTTEAILINRLGQLRNPAERRRFDVYADNLPDVAAREARSVDTFVALRPSGARLRRGSRPSTPSIMPLSPGMAPGNRRGHWRKPCPISAKRRP